VAEQAGRPQSHFAPRSAPGASEPRPGGPELGDQELRELAASDVPHGPAEHEARLLTDFFSVPPPAPSEDLDVDFEPSRTRKAPRAMYLTVGMLTSSLALIGGFMAYQQLVVPQPVELGSDEPVVVLESAPGMGALGLEPGGPEDVRPAEVLAAAPDGVEGASHEVAPTHPASSDVVTPSEAANPAELAQPPADSPQAPGEGANPAELAQRTTDSMQAPNDGTNPAALAQRPTDAAHAPSVGTNPAALPQRPTDAAHAPSVGTNPSAAAQRPDDAPQTPSASSTLAALAQRSADSRQAPSVGTNPAALAQRPTDAAQTPSASANPASLAQRPADSRQAPSAGANPAALAQRSADLPQAPSDGVNPASLAQRPADSLQAPSDTGLSAAVPSGASATTGVVALGPNAPHAQGSNAPQPLAAAVPGRQQAAGRTVEAPQDDTATDAREPAERQGAASARNAAAPRQAQPTQLPAALHDGTPAASPLTAPAAAASADGTAAAPADGTAARSAAPIAPAASAPSTLGAAAPADAIRAEALQPLAARSAERAGSADASGEPGFEQWLERAESLSRRGQSVQAVDAYERALQARPGAPVALAGKAYAYLNLNDRTAAKKLAQQAVAADPTSSRGWIVLGAVEELLGSRSAAQAAYRRCAEQGVGVYVAECRKLVR